MVIRLRQAGRIMYPLRLLALKPIAIGAYVLSRCGSFKILKEKERIINDSMGSSTGFISSDLA
jgi:hypothetical protein